MTRRSPAVAAAARITLLATVVLSCVSCDQWTKRIAAARLDGMPSLSFFGDLVRLSYVENPGAMLGFGTNLPDGIRAWLLVAIGILTSVALGAFALRAPRLARAEVVAIALLIGGAAGNLIDRIGIGAVRDFLNLGVGSLRTGIFNVADLAITTGVVILGASLLRKRAGRPDALADGPDAIVGGENPGA